MIAAGSFSIPAMFGSSWLGSGAVDDWFRVVVVNGNGNGNGDGNDEKDDNDDVLLLLLLILLAGRFEIEIIRFVIFAFPLVEVVVRSIDLNL